MEHMYVHSTGVRALPRQLSDVSSLVSSLQFWRLRLLYAADSSVLCYVSPAEQMTDRKMKTMKGLSAADIEFKIGHVEHKVKNRDLVLDVIENRLARLEQQGGRHQKSNDDTQDERSSSDDKPKRQSEPTPLE